MIGIIFSNIDIFFTFILIVLYAINVFFTRDLFFRFLIFFCSEFVSIINLLFIFYKQDNFLILLLLNVFFMLLIVYLLFYSKHNKNIIEMPIGNNNKYVVMFSVILFVVVFLMFSFSFIKINDKKIIESNNENNLLINNRSYIKKNNGIDIKNELVNIQTGGIDYQYIKQPRKFRNVEFLKRYNFLIISYTAFVVFMFFLSKSYKNLKKENEK